MPAWLAVTVQMPAVVPVAVVPLTLQLALPVNVTASPALLLAVMVLVCPT